MSETAAAPAGTARPLARSAVALAALGVVFGDIGTSPLYTVQTIFDPSDPHPVAVSRESVYGVISLIFWAVTAIVTVQYVILVMRADNDGEGGIMALIALVRRAGMPGTARTKVMLAALGIFGASLFFGDSMITPAISVMSAVEGLDVVAPSLSKLIVPITAVVILALFAGQRFGTHAVGRLFGPVMLVWFGAIAACGLNGVVKHPEILGALSPTHAITFLFSGSGVGFFALAAVVLAVTGAEALYADMGHFGRSPITRAWLFVVFPACLLSYLGQGALVLHDPGAIANNPFFVLVPHWGRVPMILLATAATVIASQAVITGAFSLTRQAIQLGYLPRLRIEQTSAESYGQIYVPWINWALLVSVLTLVFTFESSTKLAFAYGTAVTATISITATLYFYLVRRKWRRPLWAVVGGAAVILSVDLAFFAANLTKVFHGAWLPLLIGLIVYLVMSTWQQGRRIITAEREQEEGTLQEFVDAIAAMDPPLLRVPGTAVFLNRAQHTAPLAMRTNVEHNKTLHRHVLILSLETLPVPFVDDADRLTLDDLGHRDDGISLVNARYGFKETPNVPHVVQLAASAGLEMPLETEDTTYFLSKIDIRPSHRPGMAMWRKRLFHATSRITSDASDYFGLPRDRTIIVGSRIEF